MKYKMVGLMLLSTFFLMSACANTNVEKAPIQEGTGQKFRGMMPRHHGQGLTLNDSLGTNQLKVPKVLESDRADGNDVYYTVKAQVGKTSIFKGEKTKTLGYNGDFLGPVIKVKKGQKVHIKTVNQLKEDTTFHWHGLILPGKGDGGPHEVVKPGEEKEISFHVNQSASTLWFHPHPLHKTGEQVYRGLAGLLMIEDEHEQALSLPREYGENDFPIILQDRFFTTDNQLDYQAVKNEDGTMGNILLINGTVDPYLEVKPEKIRLRLLNGSNMRNYRLSLSDDLEFQQIASDGGLLNEPLNRTSIFLTPSERAEVVLDLSRYKDGDVVKIINEDGAVVLPIKIKGASKETSSLPMKLNEIEKEDLSNQEVTKKVTLAGMGRMVTINGKKFDPHRVDFTQKVGEEEIWEIYNQPTPMGGMIHPFHIHGTQFKVLSINGKEPPKSEQGYKDTVAVRPDERVKITVRFEEEGMYMFHCHILEHEDNGMMGQINVTKE